MFENKKKVANRCAVHARVYYAKDLWYGSIHKQTVIRVTFTKPSWLGSASKK